MRGSGTGVVLAFSGSAAAAAAIPALGRLVEGHVVTITLDVGQGGALDQVRDLALDAGAARAHVVDAREELARDVILPALGAGIVTLGGRAYARELTRPVIARHLVEAARMEGASSVAHGASGVDARRLARLVADLAPGLACVALADIAPQPRGEGAGRHVDENLWGRTVTSLTSECDPLDPPPDALFTLTAPATGISDPAVVEITVAHGIPVAVNGVPMSLVELMEVVGTIAGDHGVGRTDTLVGHPPVRAIGEAPAAMVLAMALAELEQAALDARLAALKAQLVPAYAALVDEGAWFSEARAALDAFMSTARTRVNGVVRLQLAGGVCRLLGRRLDQPAPSGLLVA